MVAEAAGRADYLGWLHDRERIGVPRIPKPEAVVEAVPKANAARVEKLEMS